MPDIAHAIAVIGLVLGGAYLAALLGDYLLGVYERSRTMQQLERRISKVGEKRRRKREGPLAAKYHERRQ
jgi:hypothetical protein